MDRLPDRPAAHRDDGGGAWIEAQSASEADEWAQVVRRLLYLRKFRKKGVFSDAQWANEQQTCEVPTRIKIISIFF